MASRFCKNFVGVEVGDKFSSYDEVKEKITTVQEQSHVPLLLRDCVTLRGAVRRRPNIAMLANPTLEYHSLHFICIFGRGDVKRYQRYLGLGISPEYLSSDDERCNAEIKFGLSADYQQLEVKRIIDVHNHKISQKLYKIVSLSKISPSSVSPGLVSEITPKRNRIRGRRIAFKHLTEQMYSVRGTNYEIYENGMRPYALFFQTDEMRSNFKAYPEVLIVDSNYEISALRIYLHVLMNADGNGQCAVVGFCFAMEERIDIVSFLIKTFLKFNPESCRTKSIMVDRSFHLERSEIIMPHFPNATSFLCYRFSVRAYKTAVSYGKGVAFQNTQEKEMCAELFRNMALAKDEKSYRASFQRFKLYAPPALYNYFLSNWHSTKSRWVDFLKDSNSSFLDQRNSGMERIERNLTRVCDGYKSMPSFFSLLLSTVSSTQLERKQKAVNIQTKGPIFTSLFRLTEIQYRNFLTPYAYSLVKEQIRSATVVKILDDREKCTVVSPKYGEISCTPTSCPCVVFTVMGLPCCHIFAVRSTCEMPAFSKSLCKHRWSLQYLRRSLGLDMDDVELVLGGYFGSRGFSDKKKSVEQNAGGNIESTNAGGAALTPKSVRTIDKCDIEKDNDESPMGLYCEEMAIDEAPRFTPEHGSIMIHHFTVDPDGDDNLPEEEANDGEPIETDAAID